MERNARCPHSPELVRVEKVISEGGVIWDLLGAKMGNAKIIAVILGSFLGKVRHLVL